MTVGETLTEARSQAGLSVDELSERTRIRGTVIRSIEQDDYEACGGDLYVRGYVRALAGAVGIDAQPLIREFDRTGAASETRARARLDRPARQRGVDRRGDRRPTCRRPPIRPAAVDRDPAASADPGATRFDLPRSPVTPRPPRPTCRPCPRCRRPRAARSGARRQARRTRGSTCRR